jgi:hypothetical protein
MKELLAGFAAEIFRPVVTLLIPGFWMLAPWTIALFFHHPIGWIFAAKHREGSGLVFVVIATALGMILEDLGVRLEQFFFERHTKKDYTNWYAYLALAPEREPIGLRYIRTVVLRMKFELGMGLAGPAVIAGIVCNPISLHLKSALIFLVFLLTIYFLYESSCSVVVLEKTRIEMLKHLSPITSKSIDIG